VAFAPPPRQPYNSSLPPGSADGSLPLLTAVLELRLGNLEAQHRKQTQAIVAIHDKHGIIDASIEKVLTDSARQTLATVTMQQQDFLSTVLENGQATARALNVRFEAQLRITNGSFVAVSCDCEMRIAALDKQLVEFSVGPDRSSKQIQTQVEGSNSEEVGSSCQGPISWKDDLVPDLL